MTGAKSDLASTILGSMSEQAVYAIGRKDNKKGQGEKTAREKSKSKRKRARMQMRERQVTKVKILAS